ncbi:MAG: Signal protein [Betaproteobacteria bacterium]|nr:Signal protein [Betaproteobacteria bacterium]
MSDSIPKQWAFPAALQPTAAEVDFDLPRALDAVVMVRSEIPDDAFTAQTLGTERAGYGVVIREDGLTLTIGYLITEAETIWLSTNHNVVVPGTVLGYDHATGFGLVQPLGQLGVRALARGSAADLAAGDDVYVIGQGGLDHALKAHVSSRREFAGYWEYLLDSAIFTVPAHPQWGGAALLDGAGRLVGIGSLLIQEDYEGKERQVNMFVPVDLLEPILASMLSIGRSDQPVRPWLGMYAQEDEGKLVVAGLAAGGPAERAGVKLGDMVLGVSDQRVNGLPAFLRRVWSLGVAGVEVPLQLARQGDVLRVRVRSANRTDFFRKPKLH